MQAADDEANAAAGKLFAGNANAAVGDIAKAASAVTAVSGEQILKAIVDAAGDQDQAGAAAGAATNPIAAAIGDAGQGAAFGEDMKKSDKIAAAIVLRGVAKDGKFAVANANANDSKASVKSAVDEVSKWLEEMIKAATEAATKGGGNDKIGDVGAANAGAKADKDSVNGIAKGIKGIVAAAGKAFGKEGNALKDVKEAADGEANADAGKLFAGNANAAVGDIGKAAGAVSAVSGEQILKAIVDAAGDKNQEGAAAGAATNPIEAAIGDAGAGATGFANAGMKKSDNIAAAIVLRGVAKDGKFAAANDNKASVKSAVESAVDEVSAWLKEMITAAGEAATKGGTGGDEKIGDSAANNAGKADESSVKGIAKGIKGIVAAAGKALGEKGALKDVKEEAAAGDDNKDAGKLFAGQNGNGAADVAGAIAKAAGAVSAVSGEQILKAIVEAAGDAANQEGAAAAQATNPIAGLRLGLLMIMGRRLRMI
ncbi:Outer surface protein VlsE (plasmid) [Borreliella afzelii PKo]|uniref:Variable large protein n=1 Tax=Borreliella afzelii (strain PKo) TaxID=390236 RepID=G0ITS3_BORAP|nr:Outer surface protein VlsE [Borreliella afzelii PKo]